MTKPRTIHCPIAISHGLTAIIVLVLGLSPAASAFASACTSYEGGSLCIVPRGGQGYDAILHRGPSSPPELPWYVDFNLYCYNGTWYGDDGSFTIDADETKSYVFKVGYQGACQVRLLTEDGQLLTSTPFDA